MIFKLKIKPVAKAQGRYDVMADISTKLPPKQREAAVMFVGPDGDLTNRDPRQPDLPGLRAVEAPRGPAVRVEQPAPATGLRVG